jgi:serine/threonine-protein kinase HipA
MSLGINPGTLSSLDRLCFVGSSGMGALSYEPQNPSSSMPLSTDLDKIEDESDPLLNS